MKKLITTGLLVFVLVYLSPITGQWEKNYIDYNIAQPSSMDAGDIDGDGDCDIAAAIYGDRDFVWYENDNTEFTKHMIDSEIGGVGVYIADIDGDDTLDLTLAGFSAGIVIWYKNEGGSPITWTPDTIDDNLNGAEFVCVGDIDNDGDPDVVATGTLSDLVVWYKNDGGTPINWIKDTIDSNLDQAIIGIPFDIDGDDTLDVVANGTNDNDVVWYKNDNAGKTWTKNVIDGNLEGVTTIRVADIDNDGDPDVAATGRNAGDVVWYEHNGDTPVSWTKHTIDWNLVDAFALYVADIDTNGTLDLFASSNWSTQVVWYANDGGSPIAWKKYSIDENLEGAWDITVCDMDGDDLIDAIVNQWMANEGIAWYENPGSFPSLNQLAQNDKLNIYPNPVNDKLTIEPLVTEPFSIDISTLSGQLLYSTKMESGSSQLDISFIQNGIYFITIRSKGFVRTEKIIKM